MPASHGHLQGRAEAVVAVTSIFLVLSTLFVFFRMLSRAAIVKKIAVDDYFIVTGWAIAVGLCASIFYGCAWGLGRHESNIPFSWQHNLRTADYVFSVLYQPALMATKTSILAFYLSLPTSNKNFKWACIATLFVVNAGGLALGLFTVFQCSPVGAAFEVPMPHPSSCTDIITIYLSSTPLNIITDLALLFLPMPILTGMRLPRRQKIILVITFSFGAFATIVDVIRIVYLQSASTTRLRQIVAGTHSSHPTTEVQTDFSWYASLSFMWSAIEVNIGIMVACVPGLKPLVSRFLPYMLRAKGEASSKNASISLPSEMKEPQSPPPILPANAGLTRVDSGEQQDDHDDGAMGMMDFLTTPEMNEFPQPERTQTAFTNATFYTAPDTQRRPSFFDFVDMGGRKSMVRMTVRESVFPIAMVTVLFFIWGFEYGLIDVLNAQFQRVAHMSTAESTGIHSAYFAGYLFGPLLAGRLVLKHWGFKACYTVGLSIYGCGTLIFWPAAVLTSFSAFVITNFIVAFGLSILEVSANPFILLCGPPQYGEMRLNLSQGVQAIGTVVAPLIANKAFFHKNLHSHAPSLVDTQWAYLGISLFTILLAVVYYYVPLPEATDAELEDAAERVDGANKAKIGSVGVIWITLAFGVFSQFCYVGAQEVNGTQFDAYLAAIAPARNAANYMAIAHTAFAMSRFLAAGLGFWVKPRVLMLGFFLGAIVFEALAMHYSGDIGTAMIIMTFFFEGPLFSLIFGQALRGLGAHTKLGSVFVTAAVSGGAAFSPISNLMQQRAKFSLVVAVAVFAAGTLFPLWLNLNPLARRQCDPVSDAKGEAEGEARPASAESRASRALSFLNLGLGKKRSEEAASAEWKERTIAV